MYPHVHQLTLPISVDTIVPVAVVDEVRRTPIRNRTATSSTARAHPRLPRVRQLWGAMLDWVHDYPANRLADRLRENEEQMALAADAAHFGIWIWDVCANTIRLSDQCRELFALGGSGDVSCEAFLDCIHPEDRAAIGKAMCRAVWEKSSYHAAYRLRRPDGTVHYIEATGRVDREPARKSTRMLGICIDVSERRRAEEAARELSGRLISAQEDERRRIARDLHDDLNQRLALLSVEMELCGRTAVGGETEWNNRLQQLASHVKEISSEIHKLSYELHPAKLDQLGLLAAARAFCRESAERGEVRVEFVHENVPKDLPADVALCLYRVLQESIQNVIRHSGAKRARTELKIRGQSLQLVITDSGKGFDVDRARRNGGLGLISMQERVRLVHGTIAVLSKPGQDTRVEVNVPLPEKI